MESADFWDNPKAAQNTVAQLKSLRARYEPLKGVVSDFEEAKLAYEMALLKRLADQAAVCLRQQRWQTFQFWPSSVCKLAVLLYPSGDPILRAKGR